MHGYMLIYDIVEDILKKKIKYPGRQGRTNTAVTGAVPVREGRGNDRAAALTPQSMGLVPGPAIMYISSHT